MSKSHIELIDEIFFHLCPLMFQSLLSVSYNNDPHTSLANELTQQFKDIKYFGTYTCWFLVEIWMGKSVPPSYLSGIWKLQPGDSWLSKMPNYSFNTQRTAVQQKLLKPGFLWPTNIFILVLLHFAKRLKDVLVLVFWPSNKLTK